MRKLRRNESVSYACNVYTKVVFILQYSDVTNVLTSIWVKNSFSNFLT